MTAPPGEHAQRWIVKTNLNNQNELKRVKRLQLLPLCWKLLYPSGGLLINGTALSSNLLVVNDVCCCISSSFNRFNASHFACTIFVSNAFPRALLMFSKLIYWTVKILSTGKPRLPERDGIDVDSNK